MFFNRKKKARKTFEKPVNRDPGVMPQHPVTSAPAPRSVPVFDGQDETSVTPKRRKVNANKTRLMGFDTSDGHIVDLFSEDKKTTETTRFQYPVGMVMVTKGPGFGECFAVKTGMSQIGRGDDQAIKLDFGDMAISRENHAAIVYDPKEHSFLLGHGGKSNIVRLNGKPVVSTSDMKDGDEIEIGETRLRFVAICSPKFNWTSNESEEGTDDDDMEIA